MTVESAKVSLFDVLVYLIPGSVTLMAACILFDPSIRSLHDLGRASREVDVSSGIVAALAAYVIGHVIDYLGSKLYYDVHCRFAGTPHHVEKHPTLSHAQQRALVRQYSLENYSYLQTWKLLKNMLHNLALALLLVALVSLWRMIQARSADWAVLAAGASFGVYALLVRAHLYDKWHYKELYETVLVLRLEERASSEVEGRAATAR